MFRLCHRQPFGDRRVAVEQEDFEAVQLRVVLVEAGQFLERAAVGVADATIAERVICRARVCRSTTQSTRAAGSGVF